MVSSLFHLMTLLIQYLKIKFSYFKLIYEENKLNNFNPINDKLLFVNNYSLINWKFSLRFKNDNKITCMVLIN